MTMNYSETLEYLYNSTPVFERVGASAYKEGLENTVALDEYFVNPHRKYKTIHVAGTNGKGSTSHSLAAVLQKAGYKVGLYTSPHLVDFSERIRVNGEPIEERYVVDFVANHKAFFEPLHPSFFELVTAMAFRYFADKEVDIAVIEVGLGGRLDCTNIITPVLSVITNISFDHTGFLGNTLASIATEKAGIIKHGVPVVIGEYTEETLEVFKAKAEKENSSLILAEDACNSSLKLADMYNDVLPEFELKGYCQEKNLRTIMTAVNELQRQGILPDGEEGKIVIKEALSNVCGLTHLRGRWDKLSDSPLVICDTGHNVAGWTYLAEQIKAIECKQRRIVFGMVDDKDIDTVMQMLPKDAVYYFCQATTHRAIPVEKVAEKADRVGLKGCSYHTVKDAYDAALADAQTDDFVFVGGSSYVVADLLSAI